VLTRLSSGSECADYSNDAGARAKQPGRPAAAWENGISPHLTEESAMARAYVVVTYRRDMRIVEGVA
jgi:hypothetical protein